MKIAYHFDEDQTRWGREIVATLSAVRSKGSEAKSKVFTGSLLFLDSASELTHEQRKTSARVNKSVLEEFVNEWASFHPRG